MDKNILQNEFLTLEYLTHSLRISGLMLRGKANLFANLSNEPPIPTPYGDFHFRGGHRLWRAPEAMLRTYAPDTGELKIKDLPNGVILETQTEPGTGIRKRIEIHLALDKASVTLNHSLINVGKSKAACPDELAILHNRSGHTGNLHLLAQVLQFRFKSIQRFHIYFFLLRSG